jgi:hypothetical protein
MHDVKSMPEYLDHASQVRWIAVNLLLSFMGATLGWAISWHAFVDTALLAYLSGSSAQDVFDALEFEEFGQVGSVLRVASEVSVAHEEVNAEAFAR